MTEDNSKGTSRSRRRFLADMLFLGGGITAAGLLARTGESGTPRTSPTPKKTPCQAPPEPNPKVQGEMVVPDGDVVAPSPRPAVEGEMIAPNPAGGARPTQRPDSP